MHRVQLDAARRWHPYPVREIMHVTRGFVEQIVSSLSGTATNPSSVLVDRALAMLNRNFAEKPDRYDGSGTVESQHFALPLFVQRSDRPAVP